MHLIGRRNFLAGIGLGVGGHLLGSIFDNLLPEAMGQTPSRKVYVQYSWQDGVPPGLLPKRGSSSTDWQLGTAFAPLEPVKNQILWLQRLYNPFNAHLHGNVWSFTCCPSQPGTGLPGGPSFDRYLARAVGRDDPWPSIYLSGTGENPISADGPGTPFPPERQALRAYQRIFGGGVAGAGALADVAPRQRAVLDFLVDDIIRLKARLAAPEAARLDQYLTNVREMERRIITLSGKTSTCGVAPPSLMPPKSNDLVDPDNLQGLSDIAANAIICGLSRVLTIQLDGGVWGFLGTPTGIANHNFFHSGDSERHVPYAHYHAGWLLGLRRKLEAARQGNGTIADSTVIMATNVAGTMHHTGSDNMWMMLIGGAGYFKTGQYVEYQPAEHSTNDAFVSLAHAVGVQATAFGQVTRPAEKLHRMPLPERVVRGPLARVT